MSHPPGYWTAILRDSWAGRCCKQPLAILSQGGRCKAFAFLWVCDSIGNPVRAGLSALGECSAGQATICFLRAYAVGKAANQMEAVGGGYAQGGDLLIKAMVRKDSDLAACDVTEYR